MPSESNIRIDKWLWAVRVFKTRSQAADACKKEKVLINDIAVKPSRFIKVEEIVYVKKNPVIYKFKVKALLGKRVGAKLVTDYLENLTPESELEKLEMMRDSNSGYRKRGLGRPTKKERRTIDNISGKQRD